MNGPTVIRTRNLLRSALLLAFALTLAQVGALAHGYTHWQAGAGSPDRAAPHSSLCGDCATFGAVLVPSGSTGATVTLPVAAPVEFIVESFPARASSALRHHFQAQGPPALR
jgi:hypothetical protein